MIFNLSDEHVTQEQINEAKRIGEREGRIQALNKLTDDLKKELRREIPVYRRKNASAPLSQPDTPLPPAERWLHHLHRRYVSCLLSQLLQMTFN
jgi:hypothetical protein